MPSAPGCTSSSAALVCTAQLLLQPGSYVATIGAYGGTGGSGQLLSTGQREPFTIAAGAANAIALTLDGVPASLLIQPNLSRVAGTVATGYTIYGSGVVPFTVEALDAAGELIVGPGAPSFGATSTNPAFAVSGPRPNASNTLEIQPPAVTNSETTQITVSAAFASAAVCREADANCSESFLLTLANDSTDDWTTYAHDAQRTGTQTQSTGISTSSASSLQLAWWHGNLNGPFLSSPVVYGGLVIAVNIAGVVYALDAQTGALVWQTQLPSYAQSGVSLQVRATPTIDGDRLFIGDMYYTQVSSDVLASYPSDLFALDLTSGKILWVTRLEGTIRGQVLAQGGRLYVGASGGDPPSCLQGGMNAIDENTGTILWFWPVSPSAGNGGSSWSPVTFDGTHVVFGTGNTCTQAETTADATVALNLDGSVAWIFQANDDRDNSNTEVTGIDNDQGGGISYVNGSYYLENKDGNVYALDGAGQLVASHAYGGLSSVATVTSDGSFLIADIGTPSSPSAVRRAGATRERGMYLVVDRQRHVKWKVDGRIVPLNSLPSGIAVFDTAGNPRWSAAANNPLYSYGAIDDGVVFAGLDNDLCAFDLATGAKLWSYATASGAYFASGPVVVPSGVYALDTYGNAWAFRLGAPSSVRSRAATRTPLARR